MRAFAFEAHHHVDHVFEHARSGDTAILGDVADQHQSHAVFLGVADQLERAAAHLTNRSGRTLDRVGMHGLDGIDDEELGRGHRAERGQDVAYAGGGSQLDRRIGQAEPRCAHPHLAGCLFPAHIDDAVPFPRDLCRSLQQQRRFTDSGIASHQDRAARNQTSAERTVEFGQSGLLANGHFARLVEVDEFHRATPARQIVLQREDRRGRIFDQRVPFRAIGALALPAVRNTATGLTDIAFLGFSHPQELAGTFEERNCQSVR